MKSIVSTALLSCAMAFAAASAPAQDAMKKTEPMAKDAMGMKKEMSMQDCKDHMAMAKPAAGMKKDEATMKKDEACAAMMKKDEAMMKKDGMEKKDAMKK